MDVQQGFLPSDKAARILGVTDHALRKWANEGKIQFVRNEGVSRSHRYYNVREYLKSNSNIELKEQFISSTRKRICYCRVSTRGQKEDLTRQISYLRGKYPEHELIKDIGSGINFKRKGLKTILEYAIKGQIEEVVVAYKDRLCRFGFDLIKWIIEEFSNGKIVVLNESNHSPEQELVTDVLSILNVFSARINGLRKYKTQIKEELEDEGYQQINFEE